MDQMQCAVVHRLIDDGAKIDSLATEFVYSLLEGDGLAILGREDRQIKFLRADDGEHKFGLKIHQDHFRAVLSHGAQETNGRVEIFGLFRIYSGAGYAKREGPVCEIRFSSPGLLRYPDGDEVFIPEIGRNKTHANNRIQCAYQVLTAIQKSLPKMGPPNF